MRLILETWRYSELLCLFWTGTHFTDDVSIKIQIQLKFPFVLIERLLKGSIWNFVYDTTSQLSRHVHNFVVIRWSNWTIAKSIFMKFGTEFKFEWEKSLVKWGLHDWEVSNWELWCAVFLLTTWGYHVLEMLFQITGHLWGESFGDWWFP